MLGFRTLVRDALIEDIGQGDITTNATIPPNIRCKARLFAKQDGVLSGITIFRTVFEESGAEIADWYSLDDGTKFTVGQDVALFSGVTRAVLQGERVALNFVQRLSGVATFTAKFVAEVQDMGVRICDTRKTTPLMRVLEKQAVVHGGGANHRFALFDGVLIKENHITAAGGVAEAVTRAIKGTHHLMKVGVEVTDLEEFDEALASGADAILLDNMSLEDMREAAERAKGHKVVLEASGNVDVERLRAIAETGMHVISIGALTHSAPAIDLSLEIANV
jgi:nicotinate-nucleotide pyrophosphorylase (carboxylating)